MLIQPSHDRLQRRRRDKRMPTGKRISLTERDLIWLERLHHHGPLPSSYLHAFTQYIWRSRKRAIERLTDLFHETDTQHGGAYLDRPLQQFRSLEARYQELVFDVAPAGEQALRTSGLWSERAGGATGPWFHRHMVACITASIELATLANDRVRYIPGHKALERAGVALRWPVSLQNPKTKKTETRDLIPDALFGLEYETPDGPRYRFFVVEADRATEPTRTSNFNRKSHQRTIQSYLRYIGNGLYRDHLGLKCSLLVLVVTTQTTTMNRMLALTDELSPGGCAYMLYRTWEHFGRSFSPPPVLPELLTEPWQRSGYPEFRIDRC